MIDTSIKQIPRFCIGDWLATKWGVGTWTVRPRACWMLNHEFRLHIVYFCTIPYKMQDRERRYDPSLVLTPHLPV